MKQFNEDLQTVPWHVADIFEDINDKHFVWETLFAQVINDHLPQKQMKVRSKDVPYMTQEWKDAIKKKRKYAQLFARDKSPENFELKKKWRNVATSCRRKAIKEYWSKISEELTKNPKKYYNAFKPFMGKEKANNYNKNINIESEENHHH